jgi:predicted nucleic acid-binding Zn ribbon protein
VTERYKRNPNTKCVVCSRPIYRRPAERKRGRVFCSQVCYGIANRKETPCVVCGTPILASANAKTCGRACSNKNRAGIKYTGRSPKDKVKDERSIKVRVLTFKGEKCERCGYDKKEILNVHHKDRNHGNNDMSNLELLCPNCHAEEHYLSNSWLSSALTN